MITTGSDLEAGFDLIYFYETVAFGFKSKFS